MKRRVQKDEKLVSGRILYSVLIIALYLFGKSIPIPWIATTGGAAGNQDQSFIAGVLGSTNENGSILMLGVMPYMTASVIISMFTQGRGSRRQNVSPQKIQRATLLVSLLIAAVQGLIRSVQMVAMSVQLQYSSAALNVAYLPLDRVFLTTLVLVTGSFVTIFLTDRNSRWGIGGSSLIIMVNILDSGRGTLLTLGQNWREGWQAAAEQSGHFNTGMARQILFLIIVLAILLLILSLTTLFERSDLRLPVRHIMINNSYGEKDYIAIKLNPIGTMPIMYVMSFFMLPYYIFLILGLIFPGSRFIEEVIGILNLNNVYGLLVFAVMLFILTISMAVFMIGPKNIAENLQKGGDYIEGCDPGKETERKVMHTVVFAAVLSSLMMIAVTVVPMVLGVVFGLPSELTNLPMTILILSGISAQMTDQVQTLRTMESYRPFL